MLLKLKKQINNPKNNKIVERSNIITIIKWAIILLIISIKSQKTSFGQSNLLINDWNFYKHCFARDFCSHFLIFTIYNFLLKCIFCVYYLVLFLKDQTKKQILKNSKNKIKGMTFAYASKLDFKFWTINVETSKIDCFSLQMFDIVWPNF